MMELLLQDLKMFELTTEKVLLTLAIVIPIPGDMVVDALHYYGFINLLAQVPQ